MKMIDPKREELLTTWITLYKLQINGQCDKVQHEAISLLLPLIDKEQNRRLNQ